MQRCLRSDICIFEIGSQISLPPVVLSEDKRFNYYCVFFIYQELGYPANTNCFRPDLLVVNRRETAQALLDLIKTRCEAAHYQSIREVLRELASTQVGSGCNDPESGENSQGSTASRATDLMERLRQLLLNIPGCVKLRLCERMA